ncbi:MAG: hypothetical protein Q7K57_52340 [Burkholderiaceae bacterium]|nr:hypothetical protein [Burkholderiaceae bacterium]
MKQLPFISITKAKAQKLERGVAKLGKMNANSLCFVGKWSGRQFVVSRMGEADRIVNEPCYAIEALTLTLPLSMDHFAVAKAFAKFGASVNALFRNRKKTF